MSNYVKSTNFTSKDTLPSGSALKIIKGSEFDTEFNAIATAVSTKADLVSPTFTGTPIAPTASAGDNSTQLATTAFVQSVATAVKAALFPVGSIYTNATDNTNPATLLGFGTWTAFGTGRVPVGYDASNSLFNAAEKTGGSADSVTVSHTHTGTTASNGSHSHFIANTDNAGGATSPSLSSSNYLTRGNGGGGTSEAYQLQGSATTASVGLTSTASAHTHTFTTDSTGSSGTNANYPPFITVYMWKRTA